MSTPSSQISELADNIVWSYFDTLRSSHLGFLPEDVDPATCLFLLTANFEQEFPVHYLHGVDLSQYSQSPYSEEVSKFFTNHLYQLDPLDDSKCFNNISGQTHGLLQSVNIDREDFKELYIAVTHRVFGFHDSHRIGFFIPKEVEDFISFVSDIHGYDSVYAPHNLGAALIRKFSHSSLHISSKHEQTYIHQQLHSLVLADEWQIQIDHRDFFCESATSSAQPSLIISTPPLGLKLKHSRADEYYPNCKRSSDASNLVLTLEELSNDGKAILLTTTSFLLKSGIDERVRVDLVDSNVIESVIMLPPRIFLHGSTQSVILILDKSRAKGQPVKFIDASTLKTNRVLDVMNLRDVYNSDFIPELTRLVDIEEIRWNNYNLTPRRYTMAIEDDEVPQDHQLLAMGSVVTLERGRHHDTVGKLVNPSDFDETGTPSSFSDINLSDLKERRTIRVDDECLLIPKIQSKQLKVAHFVPDGEPIYVRDSMLILRPQSDSINLSWLTLTMLNPAFYKKLLRVSHGSQANMLITWRELSAITIVVPNSEKQQQRATELARGALLQLKVKEVGLEEIIESTKREYLDNVRVKKHNLAQFVCSLQRKLSVLTMKLEKGLALEPNSPIGRKEIPAKEYLGSIYQDSLKIGELVKRLDDEQVVHPIETIEILPVLKQKVKDADLGGVQVEFDTSISLLDLDEDKFERISQSLKKAKVQIAQADIDQIFMNMLENILSHGFGAPDNVVKLKILLNYDEHDHALSILFANDGSPLPLGMNTRRYILNGEKAGRTGNSGIGGFHIHKIMEHVGGRVQLHDFHRIDDIEEPEDPEELSEYDHSLGFHHMYPDLTVGVELFFPNIN